MFYITATLFKYTQVPLTKDFICSSRYNVNVFIEYKCIYKN